MMIMNRVRVLVEGSLSGQKGGLPVDILIWGDSGKVVQRAGLEVEAGSANGDMCLGQPYSQLNELQRHQNLSWE